MKFIYNKVLPIVVTISIALSCFAIPVKAFVDFNNVKTVIDEIGKNLAEAYTSVVDGLKETIDKASEGYAMFQEMLGYSYSDWVAKIRAEDWTSSNSPINLTIIDRLEWIKAEINEDYNFSNSAERIFYSCLAQVITNLATAGKLTTDIVNGLIISQSSYISIIDTAFDVAVSTIHTSVTGAVHGGGGSHRGDDGERSYTVGRDTIIIGGKEYPVFGTNNIDVFQLYTHGYIGSEQTHHDYYVPFFEYNGNLYILKNNSIWEHTNAMYYNYTVGICIRHYNTVAVVETLYGDAGFNVSNVWNGGFHDYDRLNIDVKDGNLTFVTRYIQAKLYNNYYNTSLNKIQSLSEIGLDVNQVKERLKLIYFERYYSSQSDAHSRTEKFPVWLKSQFDNQYYQKGQAETSVVFPALKTEELIKKGKDEGLIDDNSLIELDENGIKKIGDLTIDELRQLLGLTDPTEPTEPAEPSEYQEKHLNLLERILQEIINIKDFIMNGLKFEFDGDTIINEAGTTIWDFLSGIWDFLSSLTGLADTLVGGILELADTIIESLKDVFIALFVPSENFVNDKFSGFQSTIDEKLPVVNQLNSFQSDFTDYLFGEYEETEENTELVTFITTFSDNETYLNANVSNDIVYIAEPFTGGGGSDRNKKNYIPEIEIEIYGAKVKVIDFSFMVDYRDFIHGIIITVAYLFSFKKILKRIIKLVE